MKPSIAIVTGAVRGLDAPPRSAWQRISLEWCLLPVTGKRSRKLRRRSRRAELTR